MNWAWDQQLSPTPKLILMALADAATMAFAGPAYRRWQESAVFRFALSGGSCKRLRRAGCCSPSNAIARMVPVLQTGIDCGWEGVTDCHRPLTVVTSPGFTPTSRTHPYRLLMSQEVCHAKAKDLLAGV